jgi:molybdopterin-containing oxidoreductase family membrane subunit
VPLLFFWAPARRRPAVLFEVSVAVLIGMWLERFNIIVPSLGHDFSPYTWGIFVPALVDTTLTIGSFGFFFLLFLGFIRLMPSVSIGEVKETLPAPLAAPPRPVA